MLCIHEVLLNVFFVSGSGSFHFSFPASLAPIARKANSQLTRSPTIGDLDQWFGISLVFVEGKWSLPHLNHQTTGLPPIGEKLNCPLVSAFPPAGTGSACVGRHGGSEGAWLASHSGCERQGDEVLGVTHPFCFLEPFDRGGEEDVKDMSMNPEVGPDLSG